MTLETGAIRCLVIYAANHSSSVDLLTRGPWSVSLPPCYGNTVLVPNSVKCQVQKHVKVL